MSRYLLDTHALLFWWGGGEKLGSRARATISDPASGIYVSAATAWEVATKFRIGKLDNIGDPAENYRRLMASNGFNVMPVEEMHGLRAGLLQGPHGDPFDRMIAAQSLIEDMPVITRDREFANFGCKVIW